jgi:rhamnulokinase
MPVNRFLAADLGAESGRVMLGTLEDGRLTLEDLHRFPNEPVRLPTGLYWDTLRLFHEILRGLTIAGRERKLEPDGIAVDTWGVDFALLDSDGALADNPRHYRDARNNGMLERTFPVVPRAEIFAQTGLQFMQLNSLYQWYAMKLADSPALQIARTLLFMPDLFHYFLTGVRKAELTIASTSQFYNPLTHTWASDLLGTLGLDPTILPEIVPAGTRLGPILSPVADLTGLPADTPVYATAGHDTASAVAAVPAGGDSWCYISSGTWSLMGVELDRPIISEECLALDFTNEIGAEGRVRLLKNIAGMWMLQECRRAWALEGTEYSYDALVSLASQAEPFTAVISPDAFPEPGHMPERIIEYCRRSGQRVPKNVGSICRTILESLALRYRQVLEWLEKLTGRKIETIHIVGGGSRNRLLNQWVADCSGCRVISGPTEATAAGNVLVQAIGASALEGLADAREVVRRSFDVEEFLPASSAGWDSAYDSYRRITG